MSGINLPNIFRRRKVEPKPHVIPAPEPEFQIPYWITIALTYMGTTEIPGPGSNSLIDEFLEHVGMPSDDDIAWCSAFANHCVIKAGVTGTGKPNAKSFANDPNFIKLDKWMLGCIGVYDRGTEAWMGHVGFPLDTKGKWDRLLGGNQSNRVGINNYDNGKLVGYYWPKGVPYGKIIQE
jgi:uncharacterized protein (TIGR02594 family)